jgi:uncharacterized repeat protein (TIGR04138 family)
MQAIQFEESIAAILKREKRYDVQAYFFLKDALDFTLKRVSEEYPESSRHVSGKELLEGFRDCALEQFGPMAATLMEEWGIEECRDVGNMVFRLIEEQIFGKQESDKPEDFEGLFDLNSSLREPFLPKGATSGKRAKTPSKKGSVRS